VAEGGITKTFVEPSLIVRSYQKKQTNKKKVLNNETLSSNKGSSPAGLSLRSKRSCTKRTKFGPPEGVFRIRAARKNGTRAKSWKEGGGGGEREGFLSFPSPPLSFQLFALAPFFRAARMRKAPSRGPNFVRFIQERLLRRLSRATITPETGKGRLYTGYPEKVENKIKPRGPG